MREQCAAQISSLADEHSPDFTLAVERDEVTASRKERTPLRRMRPQPLAGPDLDGPQARAAYLRAPGATAESPPSPRHRLHVRYEMKNKLPGRYARSAC